ncbi:F0F1 ATP synthase subunit A [Singulisphaera sp. PoT]|uniref:F0F1 ATP synthase subunit A n=1 Tax=Singulisphaera sp. PoT TaxID=3411797 RepID=UPI003BF5001B
MPFVPLVACPSGDAIAESTRTFVIMPEHGHSPLSHVVDHPTLELPFWQHPYSWEIHLPSRNFGSWGDLQLTRFMVTELIAGLLMLIILPLLALHVRKNQVSRGWFMNMFEALLLFIRDNVARPAIGGHGADKFLPFLWTLFFFILFNNLLGLIPGMASATGNINVTAVLAILTLVTVIRAGMAEMGAAGFWLGIVPHLDVPFWLKPPLWGLMFVIEVIGLFIRHIVLAVRLFANMFAGHVVLAVIFSFILMAKGMTFYPVMGASVVGLILLSLLELFVAFLQAYIFTFLSALFIGSAVHPH